MDDVVRDLLFYVACPECGGDLEEDEDGCISCKDCDFEDCSEEDPGED